MYKPWHTPFPFWNQSVTPCLVLTVASWPAYRFLRRRLRWSGIPISLRIFHSFLWSTVKDFSIVNEAEVDGLFFVFCFFNSLALSIIQHMLSIWSLVPLPFLNLACTSGVLVHVWLKPCLKDFEHNLAGMWNECNCTVVWTFFGIASLWDWNENWPFPVLWPLLCLSNLLAYWVKHCNNIII